MSYQRYLLSLLLQLLQSCVHCGWVLGFSAAQAPGWNPRNQSVGVPHARMMNKGSQLQLCPSILPRFVSSCLVSCPAGWNNFFMRSRNFTSFYAEFNNTGIGANLQGRVDWTRMLTPYEQSVYLSYDWLSLCTWYFPRELARLFTVLGCGQLQLM